MTDQQPETDTQHRLRLADEYRSKLLADATAGQQQPISAEDREWWRRIHFKEDFTPCLGCNYTFPCPTIRLLDALTAAEQLINDYKRDIKTVQDVYYAEKKRAEQAERERDEADRGIYAHKIENASLR
mgnify:CR=1 FL=1